MRDMRRKKRIFSIFMLLLVVVILTGCSNDGNSKKVEFWSNASDVLINAQSSDAISFNVALCSNDKIEQVEFVGIEGTNIDTNDFSATIINNNVDGMDNYKYKGVYIKYIMIELAAKNSVESCEFEKIILNIDGVNRELEFGSPIKYEFTEGNIFSEELQISVVPNEFHSSFLNKSESSAIYEFVVTEDLMITDIAFGDYIEISNIMYSIDGGTPKEISFPLQVKKGESLRMAISFTSSEAEEKNYVLTNMMFSFITAAGENKYNKLVVVFDPIYPMTDNDFSYVDRIIDRIP